MKMPSMSMSKKKAPSPNTTLTDMTDTFQVYQMDEAKGGKTFDPAKAAVLFIEYQNEFCTPGGKMHDAVKGVMEKTGMLEKSAGVADACRQGGKVTVMHTAITFEADASDNPNKGFGILAGCKDGQLFTKGSWNAAFCDAMQPKPGDVVIEGKKGLDAFPHSNLEEQLKAHGVETLVLAGFLTNCCVESTMRTAYEKGFDVITLTDCCGSTDDDAQKVTEKSFGFFSTPMTAADFKAKVA